tara:strand:- start:7730 stop:7948 length:219 start_codon:yes stop_codon:yes gene_type:complete
MPIKKYTKNKKQKDEIENLEKKYGKHSRPKKERPLTPEQKIKREKFLYGNPQDIKEMFPMTDARKRSKTKTE